MTLLGIDTSTEFISLALTRNGRLLAGLDRRSPYGASRLLVPLIKRVCAQAGILPKKLDALVVGAGPGSFTGLRISFAAVKALGLVLGKPVASVGSFFAIAWPFRRGHKKIAVVGDARRGLVYGAVFKGGETLKPVGKVALYELGAFLTAHRDCYFIFCGQDIKAAALKCQAGIAYYSGAVRVRADRLLEYAEAAGLPYTAIEDLEPLYIHPKTCQIRK